MPQRRPLDPAAPWVDVVATEDDWDAADPALLTTMYAQLVLVRTFEELVLTLAGEGLVHGPAHSSIGQEGGAVGSVLGLTSEDTVNAQPTAGRGRRGAIRHGFGPIRQTHLPRSRTGSQNAALGRAPVITDRKRNSENGSTENWLERSDRNGNPRTTARIFSRYSHHKISH